MSDYNHDAAGERCKRILEDPAAMAEMSEAMASKHLPVTVSEMIAMAVAAGLCPSCAVTISARILISAGIAGLRKNFGLKPSIAKEMEEAIIGVLHRHTKADPPHLRN